MLGYRLIICLAVSKENVIFNVDLKFIIINSPKTIKYNISTVDGCIFLQLGQLPITEKKTMLF